MILPIVLRMIILEVEITAGTNSAYNYEWNTGETTPTITAMNPGPYNVTITAGQCPIEDGITLRPYCPSYLYVPTHLRQMAMD